MLLFYPYMHVPSDTCIRACLLHHVMIEGRELLCGYGFAQLYGLCSGFNHWYAPSMASSEQCR